MHPTVWKRRPLYPDAEKLPLLVRPLKVKLIAGEMRVSQERYAVLLPLSQSDAAAVPEGFLVSWIIHTRRDETAA